MADYFGFNPLNLFNQFNPSSPYYKKIIIKDKLECSEHPNGEPVKPSQTLPKDNKKCQEKSQDGQLR